MRLVICFIVLTSMIVSGYAMGHQHESNRVVTSLDFDQFEPWLHRQTDTVYVVNFWATWCAPCIREIPDFEQIHKKYSAKKVKVLLVSLDNPNRIDNHVIPFLDRLNVKSQVVLLDDPYANRWIPKVSDQWSGAIPATVIYNQHQKMFFEKELKFEELEEIILPMILGQ
jgi:thiol-disulfide isomerase/thioredoxin